MIRYECDKCGRRLAHDDPQHYIVKIEVYAAASPLHIDDSAAGRDIDRELSQLIEDLHRADPDEIEDRTYRAFRFDLCGDCQRDLLKAPLGLRLDR